MVYFYSIRFRIFAIIFFFFTLITLTNMFYELSQSKEEIKKHLNSFSKSNLILLNKNIKSDLYNLNYTNIKNTLDSFDNEHFKNIYVLNKDGFIFVQKNTDEIVLLKYKDFDAIKRTKNNDAYFLTISFSNKDIGYLIIENDTKPLEKMLSDKKNKILNTFLIVMLITLIFAYISSLIITKPINHIINKLKNLKDHEVLEFNYTKEDEFGYLAKNIEENHKKIKDLNHNLKAKVSDEVEKNIDKDKQLFEIQKMAAMGDMIGNIAHQWRQPLTVISTGATGMQVQKEYGLLTDELFEKTCTNIRASLKTTKIHHP